MHWGRLCLVVCAAALAGCGTPPLYTPLADTSGNQVLRTNNESGKPYVLSAAPNSRVAVEQADFQHEGATFNIKVVSDFPNLVTFGPAEITVTQGGRTRTVLGKVEMDRVAKAKAESAQRSAMITETLSVFQQVLGAAMPANAPQASLAQQQIASGRQSAAMSRASADQTTADMRALSGAVAKTHLATATVAPGSMVSGLVTIGDANGDGPLDFVIRVGADRHTIRFDVSRK
jgi:hypothetical protein